MISFSRTKIAPSSAAAPPERCDADPSGGASEASTSQREEMHRDAATVVRSSSNISRDSHRSNSEWRWINRRESTSPAPFSWQAAVENGFAQLDPSCRSRLDEYLSRSRTLVHRNIYGFDRAPVSEDIGNWIRRHDFSADGVGIVMPRYRTKVHYNPLTIASQAAQCYENLFSNDGTLRTLSMKNLMRLVKFFHDTRVERGSFLTWYYYFPFQDLRCAWNSCLSQACIADVLFKYSEITGEVQHREMAFRAMAGLRRHVSEGGLASISQDGDQWLQEYPGSRRFPDVLNGHMSAALIVAANRRHLDGSIDASRISDWFATIRRSIQIYTHRRRIDYARGGGHTPVHYYPQMIAQLSLLARIDPNDLYHEYADRWRQIYGRALRRRRVIAPFAHARRRWRCWRYGL